jgi:hypothetical protein
MKREELKIRKRTINSVQRLVERDEQHEKMDVEVPAPKMGLFRFFSSILLKSTLYTCLGDRTAERSKREFQMHLWKSPQFAEHRDRF